MKSFFLTAALLAITTQAQPQPPAPTPAELLQKGIFAQETSGDLDTAIKTYRQIVDAHPQQREIGAQAQYRLGMALLAKGDTNAASQEIQRLGWDYPDFKDLIASTAAASLRVLTAQYNGRNKIFFFAATPTELQTIAEARDRELFNSAAAAHQAQPADHEALFDFTRSRTVTGTVVQIAWSNPYTMLTINNGTTDPPMQIFIASASTLERADWTRGTVKLGNQITITGAPALDGSSTLQATAVSLNGQIIFSRPNGPLPQVAIGAYEK